MLALHHDLGPGDRFFWFSTTGWMMWNYLVSGLLVGAAPVLFDGDPGHPDLDALWRMAGDEGVTFFGTTAPFLLACRKDGVEPAAVADLSALRTRRLDRGAAARRGVRVGVRRRWAATCCCRRSAGAPTCAPPSSGGCPLVPVRAGEISCRYLGAKVEAYDEAGRSVVGEQGELVITAPMPSMPVGFWGDDDGSRYRAAYFEGYPGVWTHGDWITLFPDGASAITGRSDATLNRGGVRMGTAELYSVVEALPEVADSLVVHLEDPAGGPGRLLLFVAPAAGAALDDDAARPASPGRCAPSCRPATCPTRSTPCRACPARCRARSSRCRSSASSPARTPTGPPAGAASPTPRCSTPTRRLGSDG